MILEYQMSVLTILVKDSMYAGCIFVANSGSNYSFDCYEVARVSFVCVCFRLQPF